MPIEAPSGTLDIENAKLRVSEISATTSVGIGTENSQKYPIYIYKATEPELLIQEGTSAAAKFTSNNGCLVIQSGVIPSNSSAGDIGFSTMGDMTRHVTILGSNGNVGIGVTNPATKLDVAGNVNVDGYIQIDQGKALTINPTDAFTHDQASMPHYGLLWRSHTSYPTAATLQVSGYGGMKFFTLGTERISVLPGGNVGIGTEPSYKFDVYSTDQYTARFVPNILIKNSSDNTGHIYIQRNPDSNGYVLNTGNTGFLNMGANNNTLQLICAPSGKVGIGTATPDDILETYDSIGRIKITRNANTNIFGCSLDFALRNSANEKFTYARVGGSIENNTDGAEAGFISFQIAKNGLLRSAYQEEKMRITNTGVGIGVQDPITNLELGSAFNTYTTQNMISFRNSQSGYYEWQIGPSILGGNAAFIIRGGNDGYGNLSNLFNIVNTSVGIGTTDPQAKLHVNGTILYNTKQETHDQYDGLNYTSSNSSTNLKSVTISYDGIAHVHVTGLVRITSLDGTDGTATEACYFNLRKNSTEVTASLVGHRIAKLGYTNDVDQWKPVMLSWSGVVSAGDQIHFFASAIENDISFNELDMNVLVV